MKRRDKWDRQEGCKRGQVAISLVATFLLIIVVVEIWDTMSGGFEKDGWQVL